MSLHERVSRAVGQLGGDKQELERFSAFALSLREREASDRATEVDWMLARCLRQLHLSMHHAPMCAQPSSLLTAIYAAQMWRYISTQLLTQAHPMELHRSLKETVYADWPAQLGPPPVGSLPLNARYEA